MTPPEPGAYLQRYLAPFAPFLAREGATDILAQREGEVWAETDGVMERHEVPELTATLVERLARQVAAASHQAVSRAQPLLAGRLPGGERIQIVLPPATRGFPVLAIRRQVRRDFDLGTLSAAGFFDPARRACARSSTRRLSELGATGDIEAFLREAVRLRRNIVVSGSTGSGKTTLLNALLREVPSHDRLVVIEDTPEVALDRPNAIGLIAAKSDESEARVSMDDLLQASLRLRPDRLMLGELRGREAFTFLRAVNTGHPGAITTLHADSCAGAREQLALMVLQAGHGLNRAELLTYVDGVIDVFVHVDRVGGARAVTDISYANCS